MTKKEYRTDDKEPSDMFVRSLSGHGCGSPEMTCGWCDRLHLCPTSESYTSDEDGGKGWLEDCEKQYKECPEGVILHWDADSVSGQELNGINFVVCCPCNGLSRFERFIWESRYTIRKYLRTRIDYEYDLAQQEKTLNKLSGIENTEPNRDFIWNSY
jgi:hypothetical protein